MRVTSRGGTWVRLTGYTLLAAMALGLSACGLFDIRNPIPPTPGGEDCSGELAIGPEILLDNFELSMRCGVDGSNLYETNLALSFRLFLDPVDAIETGREWLTVLEDIQSQSAITTQVADSMHFEFARVEPQILGGDDEFDTRMLYEKMPYTLELAVLTSDTLEIPTLYSGQVDLEVVEATGGRWVIRTWGDFRDNTGNPSYGAFKERYALEGPAAAARRGVLD